MANSELRPVFRTGLILNGLGLCKGLVPVVHRPGIPQPRPLHLAVPDPRRQHPRQNQCTLKPKEPVNRCARQIETSRILLVRVQTFC
ncbi:hypothetical protein FRC0378_02330 [Corynebacterium diphtheriae]|nr:hypothetical protein FRC0326_02351 [Corynebacterium diphtheriae]CAB0874754.1 hypothetical protein FRC0378_02330 [Corynebacterium diphtheriae]CAB0875537.1 hypothetical protein FRC0406_00056 [Corynebacterium diphtheriae]CAB0913548.1 hypothetical protein FRC0431_00057 [Corynebacterium diphtheriae]